MILGCELLAGTGIESLQGSGIDMQDGSFVMMPCVLKANAK